MANRPGSSEAGQVMRGATFDSHSGSKLERVIVAMGGSESNPSSSQRSSIQRYPSSKNYSYRDEEEEGTFVDTSETGSAAAVWIRFKNFMLELRREMVLEPRISLSKFVTKQASSCCPKRRSVVCGHCVTAPHTRIQHEIMRGDHTQQTDPSFTHITQGRYQKKAPAVMSSAIITHTCNRMRNGEEIHPAEPMESQTRRQGMVADALYRKSRKCEPVKTKKKEKKMDDDLMICSLTTPCHTNHALLLCQERVFILLTSWASTSCMHKHIHAYIYMHACTLHVYLLFSFSVFGSSLHWACCACM